MGRPSFRQTRVVLTDDPEMQAALARAHERGAASRREYAKLMAARLDDIECLPELRSRLSDWWICRLLSEPWAELDGRTGRQALAEGHIKQVIDVAETIGRGDFA